MLRLDMSIDELRAYYRKYEQEHVFRFWDRLTAAEQRELRAQALRIDLEAIQSTYTHLSAAKGEQKRAEISPAPVVSLPDFGGETALWDAARQRGEEYLAAGRVCALVVAGGQGTRLGFSGPKGLYPIGPVSDRSLFELQAQKLRNLRARYGVAMPWYVMTSHATDAVTREFFGKMNFFGIPRSDVYFFVQGTSPAIDFQGRLMLEAPSRIFEGPDGHGGALTALLRSGALDHMQGRGIQTIFYYQVDNPLIRMMDPSFIGFHRERGAEASSKVVRKREASEKMGVVAQIDGHLGIVEYTELDEALAAARDESGELVYWAGNIAVHLFETAFIRRVASEADRLLPLHPSAKKIPYASESGEIIAPSSPNGYKLERFVFDALPHARKSCVVEARRSEEFSPVKSANGTDSPETARADLIAEYRRWLVASGVDVTNNDASIEIDHARFDGVEDLQKSGFRRIDEAGGSIFTAAGEEK